MDLVVIAAVVLTVGVGLLSLYWRVSAYRIALRRQHRADQAAMYEFARARRHLR